MSESTDLILTDDQVEVGAKMCDGFVDFEELLGDKKIIFNLINAGKAAEKLDRLFFHMIIQICNKVASDKLGDEEKEILQTVIEYAGNDDVESLNSYLSTVLAEKFDLSFTDSDKAVYYSCLSLIKSLTQKVIEKAEEAIEVAEEEDNEVE